MLTITVLSLPILCCLLGLVPAVPFQSPSDKIRLKNRKDVSTKKLISESPN